jgi:hypothetical protein
MVVQVQDLNGKAVVTAPAYEQRIRQQYGLAPSIVDVAGVDDVVAGGNDIAMGKITAFM